MSSTDYYHLQMAILQKVNNNNRLNDGGQTVAVQSPLCNYERNDDISIRTEMTAECLRVRTDVSETDYRLMHSALSTS